MKVDIDRCQEIYEKWCKDEVPTTRKLFCEFLIEIRNRAQRELAALDTTTHEARKEAFGLRAMIREITRIMDTRTKDDNVDLKSLFYVNNEKDAKKSEASYERAQQLSKQLVREWRAELVPLYVAVYSGHVAAKPYRKFYFRFKDAYDSACDLAFEQRNKTFH